MSDDLIDSKQANMSLVEDLEGVDRYVLRGPQGKSAYDLVVEKGYTGTEQEFVDLLTRFEDAVAEVEHCTAPTKDNALQSYDNNFTGVNTFVDKTNFLGPVRVDNAVQINSDVNIGCGLTGKKACCYFSASTTKLPKSGTLTDTIHGLIIELPEDPARTIDSCITEINEQGYKLEVRAYKYNDYSICLEATTAGSAPNGVIFTRTGCFCWWNDRETTTQGSYIQGLDADPASEHELRLNGYPVASRQSNNVYEGVQVFNNTVSFNDSMILHKPITFNGTFQVDLFNMYICNEFIKRSESMSKINFSDASYILTKGASRDYYVLPPGDLDFDFPLCSSFVGNIGLFTQPTNTFTVRLHLGKIVNINGLPTAFNSNCRLKKFIVELPEAKSLNADGYRCVATHIVINAPKLESIRIIDFNYPGYTNRFEGNLGLVTTLGGNFNEAAYLTSWECHVKYLTELKLSAAKLDLASVQFIADDLKDWSGDTEKHLAIIGVSASIQESESEALQVAKEQLEAKGWTVTFNYN